MNISPTQHKILKLLIENEKISMKEMSKELSVNLSTVSRNFRPLLESGFVLKKEEVPPGIQGGRKTTLYTVNPNKFFILGIGVEQNRLIVTVLDAKGNVVEEVEKHEAFRGEEIVPVLIDCVRSLRRKFPNIVGVSVGMPGIIENNRVIFSSALDIEDFDLGGELSRNLNLEVLILNDANAAVVGYALQRRNVVYFLLSVPYYLNLPVGVGAGLWLEGRLYQGSTGASGEFEMNTLPSILKDSLTFDEVNLETMSLESLSHLIFRLSEVASFVVYLIDPETVVFGGDVALFSEAFREELKEKLLNRLKKRHVSDVEILFDSRGLWTIAVGAARAFWKRMLENYEFAQKIL
ncbi:ROK family transcriptional regulator [Thermotoga sp. SG1]|uniref:ROK family transcriptional regulator n=1 Tax=Thermotoga sp. SG1 TaxID=126739 RepID=UPI000C79270D|nr:ROK family transcriptional regulator [Thermotoga sp. SG1]PLV56917.1 ArsR family transcriptional regulator [Thermotoga sp. SG1]